MKRIKKIVIGATGAMFLLGALPATAHETRMYEIDHQPYQLVVGSLNEPIAVDDKTGIYIMVTRPATAEPGEEADHHAATGAVEGLDKTLKVEISAGDKKKTMDLTPIHGEAGAYRASFIPTVQTTYTYRFFGAIENTPIDVSFTCNLAGHPASPEDKTEVELSEGVHQTLKRGAFGCPVAKTDLGFPEVAMSEYELAQKTVALETMQVDLSATSKNMNMLALLIGVLGLAAGVGAWLKAKKS